ncbi:hypothetical protein D3C75_289540 [compost metagenome]
MDIQFFFAASGQHARLPVRHQHGGIFSIHRYNMTLVNQKGAVTADEPSANSLFDIFEIIKKLHVSMGCNQDNLMLGGRRLKVQDILDFDVSDLIHLAYGEKFSLIAVVRMHPFINTGETLLNS